LKYNYLALAFLIIGGVLIKSCDISTPGKEESLFVLLDPSQTGLHFNDDQRDFTGQEEFGYASVAVGDINNDGLMDVAITNLFIGFKLFLNKGGLFFEDVTPKLDAKCISPYGVNLVDVNADGLVDIYICQNFIENDDCRDKDFEESNLLFLNNGNLTFSEPGRIDSMISNRFSLESNFFNFNNDGIPDLLLTKFVGLGENPFNFSVLENQMGEAYDVNSLNVSKQGEYVDLLKQNNIESSSFMSNSNSIADFNNDGRPDLFIGKDFIVQDELYFSDSAGNIANRSSEYMAVNSMFSMGTDVADINNDGYLDLVVLDMLSPEHIRRKLNTLNFPITFHEKLNAVQTPQYQRNVLHLNRDGQYFSEAGFAFNIAASEWSWSPVFVDLDLDGYKDLFITNGIRRDLTNMDFVANYLNEASEYNILTEWRYNWDKIPIFNSSSFVYRNIQGKGFKDHTVDWGLDLVVNSEGAAYADFDLDGDLDIIVNNTDSYPILIKNKAVETIGNHFLRVELTGSENRRDLYGSRVYVFTEGEFQMIEFANARGFLSVSEPVAHFGLGDHVEVDSIIVVWPNSRKTKLGLTSTDQIIQLAADQSTDEKVSKLYTKPKTEVKFTELMLSPQLYHEEHDFNDFKYERLIPWQISKEGPGLAVGDINSDGLEDFIVGGGAGKAAVTYIQDQVGSFKQIRQTSFENTAKQETTDLLLFDVDNDNDLDLYMGNGSNEQLVEKDVSVDFLFINDGEGNFMVSERAFPKLNFPVGGACYLDVNSDGFQDLFIAQRNVPGQFGVMPTGHVLLMNDGQGGFKSATSSFFKELGMITDVVSLDYDNDGDDDIIAVGEFQACIHIENIDGTLMLDIEKSEIAGQTGLWRSISIADLNQDGIMDYLMGNLGSNTIFRADADHPLELYVNDFDENGTPDPVLFHYLGDRTAPFADKDLFCHQMPEFNNKFNDYSSYAIADIEEMFTEKQLQSSEYYKAVHLQSSVVLNFTDSVSVFDMPVSAQLSPVNDVLPIDLNKDGALDLITVGNSNSFHYSQGDLLGNAIGIYINNGHGKYNEARTDFAYMKFKVLNGIEAIQIGTAGDIALVISSNNSQVRVFKLDL